MPRNMSFALTTPQVEAQAKDVTRRFGWWNLKPGDILTAVEKGMGLKKGEKIRKIATIEIVSVRAEPLEAITQEDCVREGFPEMTPAQFIDMLIAGTKKTPSSIVNRIEFRYLS